MSHDGSWSIETVGLTRSYGATRVVDDLNLQVPARGIYGFLGPNGAGKTTTIRMLLGLVRPTAGEVRLFGAPTHDGLSQLLRRVGATVEMATAFGHLTGRENLEFIRQLRGDVPAVQIDRVLELVELTTAANQRAREYSLGMRVRLDIAGALLGDPDLLILDEPTNGLDPVGIRKIRTLLKQLVAERGVTVFLSSHLLSEIDQLATHVGVLSRGRLSFQGAIEDLRRRAQIRIVISVGDTAAAARLLQAAYPEIQVGAGTVTISGSADAATVNRRLVQAGIAVSALQEHVPTLEDLFVSLVSGEDCPHEQVRGAA